MLVDPWNSAASSLLSAINIIDKGMNESDLSEFDELLLGILQKSRLGRQKGQKLDSNLTDTIGVILRETSDIDTKKKPLTEAWKTKTRKTLVELYVSLGGKKL